MYQHKNWFYHVKTRYLELGWSSLVSVKELKFFSTNEDFSWFIEYVSTSTDFLEIFWTKYN